jgi:hypothetical protein
MLQHSPLRRLSYPRRAPAKTRNSANLGITAPSPTDCHPEPACASRQSEGSALPLALCSPLACHLTRAVCAPHISPAFERGSPPQVLDLAAALRIQASFQFRFSTFHFLAGPFCTAVHTYPQPNFQIPLAKKKRPAYSLPHIEPGSRKNFAAQWKEGARA